MKLRDYQQRTIDQIYGWLGDNAGHPCVVLPTGAGKSVVIAEFIRGAMQEWPETRVLMLCHQKELLEQNAEKMRAVWPGAPLGIYSASVGKKQLGEPILFAGIQSIRKRAADVGHIDLCLVDECHCIAHKEEGGYRTFLAELLRINPAMRIIGFSATPYRLGHGLITDKPALFDGLIEPVSIEELIYKGHLSILRSKGTTAKLDTTGVHKRGGEFIESELQAAVDTADTNARVVDEVIARAEGRRSWLFFCAGVEHAAHVCQALQERGITAACVTGETPKAERAAILAGFKLGQIQAVTNANVLTTGFDAPGIDLIAMLRPTMSPALYVQMAGRGLRVAPSKADCLVLDFAGVVDTHGPITAVRAPTGGKGGDGEGEAPTKPCAHCMELCPISATECPACGEAFPPPKPKPLQLRDVDIMGIEPQEMEITSWRWALHTSKASGINMLKVTYYGGLSDKPVTEYLAVLHDGYGGRKALQLLAGIAQKAGANLTDAASMQGDDGLEAMAAAMNAATPPDVIFYKMDGKYHRVIDRRWSQ